MQVPRAVSPKKQKVLRILEGTCKDCSLLNGQYLLEYLEGKKLFVHTFWKFRNLWKKTTDFTDHT